MNVEALIAERKMRWESFLSGDKSFPFLFIVRVPENAPLDFAKFAPGNEKLFVELAWKDFERQSERAQLIDDDFIPHLSCIGGTEIFAEAFGSSVERAEDKMPFALPCVNSASGADNIIAPNLGDSSLMRFFEIGESLRSRGGEGIPLRMVDIQSPIDIAALIWEKSDLLMAMLESPESVSALAMKIQNLLVEFLDEWRVRFGDEYIAHYPEYFMKGGLTLSEDECGCVSSEVFEELFLGHLNFLSDRYGGIGMHCCANSRHQWALFKKIRGLRLLNLVSPPSEDGSGYVHAALNFFNGHCAQFHYGWTPGGAVSTWPSQYPQGARYVIDVNAENLDQAREICLELRKIRELCK